MRRILLFSVIVFYCFPAQAQEFDTKKMRYIEQFKYWAMDEQIRTGVPAAISLAQGILETGSGTSELCTAANNHFGIKCKKEWTGETYLHDDDRRRECFRKYKSAKDSYIDHSNFLRDRAHYSSLFDLEVTDYQAWCKGLRKAGYATNPKYAVRLISLIEKYNLQEYSYEAIELAKENAVVAEVVPVEDKVVAEVEKKEVEVVQVAPVTTARRPEMKRVYDKLMVKHGRNGFWAHKGDYLLPEAVQYNIRYAKLLAINDLDDAPLNNDMFIYLKKKAKKGERMFHKVAEGETMHSISQETGVQLKYLYVYNNLYDNEEPAAGEKIYLQGRSTRTPRLVGTVATKPAIRTEKVEAGKIQINKPVVTEKKIEPIIVKEKKEIEKKAEPVLVEKKEVKKEVVLKKKEVKKVQKTPLREKSDAIAGVKNNLKTEIKKRTVPNKKIMDNTKKEVNIIASKPTAVRTSLSDTKHANSPVLDLGKARKVEQLMDDGSKEVERIFFENQKALEQQKIIAAPKSNTKIEEFIKEKKKRTESKKVKKKYDQKNVSEDVKDLKKKFDTLIYDDEK